MPPAVRTSSPGLRAAIERGELAAFKTAALDRLEQATTAPGQEVSRG
jgi:hypothetical protein